MNILKFVFITYTGLALVVFFPIVFTILIIKTKKCEFEWFPPRKIGECHDTNLPIFTIYD